MIPDEKDVKPVDWDDREEIPDPSDVKPSDWDESEPKFIVDEDAKKPSDWLEEEPKEIPDPSVEKPLDWDEEEYGAFEGRLIANPKCVNVSGCGKWERPMKLNPRFKGVYKRRMIRNPEYKGPWFPRFIKNPEYYEEKHPERLGKFGGLAIDIWTMQGGIAFDNILISHDEMCASEFADLTFRVKEELESGRGVKEVKKQRARLSVGEYVSVWMERVFGLKMKRNVWIGIGCVLVCVGAIVYSKNRALLKAKLL